MPQTRHYEMKDSGVEWIGEIPEHWCVKPQKRVVLQRSGGAWGDDPMNDEHDCFCMRIADFDFARGRFKNTLTENLTKRNYENSQIERLSLQHGDLLIEKSGGGEKTPVGRSVVFDKDYKALFANFMDRLRCDKEQVNPWFFGYWWRTLYFKNITVPYIKQTTGLQNLDISELLDKEQVLLPPLSEQTAIAAYLDEKCATIDAIIAEAKSSIEEYKSWKASVIFETVTKGLNPNAEMKDSGVDIIGMMPEHWSLVRQRFLCKTTTGDHDTQDADPDGQYPFYVRSPNVERSNTYTFDGESILMAGDGVGAGKVFHYATGKIAIHQRVYCFYDFCKILPRFYFYYMSSLFSTEIDKGSAKSTVASVRLPMLKDFEISLPLKDEQEAIVAYLDFKCAAIDGIILEKEDLIRELENYKRSLIFEVVTGKRRVC